MIDVMDRRAEAGSVEEAATGGAAADPPRPAITVDGVWKSYRRQTQQISLRHEALKLLSRRRRRAEPSGDEPFWALRDVSFTVRAGEAVARTGAAGRMVAAVAARAHSRAGRRTAGVKGLAFRDGDVQPDDNENDYR